jgi:hypothetical protein
MIQLQFSISAEFAMFCRELSRLLAREQLGLTRDCAFHCTVTAIPCGQLGTRAHLFSPTTSCAPSYQFYKLTTTSAKAPPVSQIRRAPHNVNGKL